LEKLFVEKFAGVLVADFWAAYDAVACGAHQRCWPHLLRELKEVEQAHRDADDWPSFSRRVRRIYTDGVKLRTQRTQLAEDDFHLATARLERRVIELGLATWKQPDVALLAGRLHKYVSVRPRTSSGV